MRAQSMNLPFPSPWGHSIVKKIADHARRGYAAGRLSADVFYRFDILTIRRPISAGVPFYAPCAAHRRDGFVHGSHHLLYPALRPDDCPTGAARVGLDQRHKTPNGRMDRPADY